MGNIMRTDLRRILATTSSFGTDNPGIMDHFEREGFQITVNPYARKITEGELGELLAKYKPVGILAGVETITRAVMEKARGHLKVISRVGVGWDNVDREAAEELGIKVFRTAGVLNQAVAELTIGMILSALRAIPFQDRQVRSGVWKKGMGRLLQDKVVGVIGFGDIGRHVGKLITAFGAKVIFCDPLPKDVPWASPVSMRDLLARADIITLHASGSELILGEKEIHTLCKKGVIIVNTARGGLLDEQALCEGLQSGQVACACLDVFENEPYEGPLVDLENVNLTPHIGSYAREARVRMEEMAVENLVKGLEEKN